MHCVVLIVTALIPAAGPSVQELLDQAVLTGTKKVVLPEGRIEVKGKLLWSNLESASDRSALPGMGFCFVKVSEADRERLREAIQKYGMQW